MQLYNPIVKTYTKYAENYDLAVKVYPLSGIKIEKYFEKTTFQEGWGEFLYLYVGIKA